MISVLRNAGLFDTGAGGEEKGKQIFWEVTHHRSILAWWNLNSWREGSERKGEATIQTDSNVVFLLFKGFKF